MTNTKLISYLFDFPPCVKVSREPRGLEKTQSVGQPTRDAGKKKSGGVLNTLRQSFRRKKRNSSVVDASKINSHWRDSSASVSSVRTSRTLTQSRGSISRNSLSPSRASIASRSSLDKEPGSARKIVRKGSQRENKISENGIKVEIDKTSDSCSMKFVDAQSQGSSSSPTTNGNQKDYLGKNLNRYKR